MAVRCCPTEAAVNCRTGVRSWFSYIYIYIYARILDLLLNHYCYQNCGRLNKQDCDVLPLLSFRSRNMEECRSEPKRILQPFKIRWLQMFMYVCLFIYIYLFCMPHYKNVILHAMVFLNNKHTLTINYLFYIQDGSINTNNFVVVLYSLSKFIKFVNLIKSLLKFLMRLFFTNWSVICPHYCCF